MQLTLSDYNIYVSALDEHLSDVVGAHSYSQVFVLCDTNTRVHCLPILQATLPDIALKTIDIQAGETYKNIETCQQIWATLMRGEADRKSLLINLGGGVIGDMGGFCAATFKRGMDFMQVPTTLLAQVDASIGGKLGIDFGDIKNSIGVFSNPKAIFIDTRFLKTLSPRELRSGFAEILKHSLIADKKAWNFLSEHKNLQQMDWSSIVPNSLLVKKDIVEKDPFERNVRKALNFGHTVGHAFESLALHSDEPLLHGEAVAQGMVVEAYLSYCLGTLSESELNHISLVINDIYGPKRIFEPSDFDALYQLMLQDKKNEGQQILCTTLNGIGDFCINQVCDKALIMKALAWYFEVLPKS